ncbi:MAG: hypothetical protein HQM14_18910 [SAR324 cluster bacterium]|nr:hypothetical protein [SAR324 cluster bacterium]
MDRIEIPSKEALPTMTDALDKQILEEFKILAEIPHFKTSHISGQIQKIEKLCQGYSSPYPKLLREIENAVFAKRVDRVKDLIQSILKHAGTPSKN